LRGVCRSWASYFEKMLDDPLGDNNEEEEVEKIDPKTLAPDIYSAAKGDNLAEVVRLLGERVPPTYCDKDLGWTALHWAAKNGNTKMTKALLEHGASGPYHRQLLRENKVDLGALLTSDDGDKENQNGVGKEDDEQEDDEFDKATDYTKNTPLLWATFKGHLAVVWELLQDGYSPNDTDDLKNNTLHLAAASGHKKIVKVLVEDGVMPTAVNIYKNRPVDMAITRDIRDIIVDAMKANASMTDKDIANKHISNMEKHRKDVQDFEATLSDFNKIESPRALRSLPSIREASLKLADQIASAKEESLDEDNIILAESLLEKFDLLQEFYDDITKLQGNMPITTQIQYIDHCQALEATMAKCIASHIPKIHMNPGKDVLGKCRASVMLCTLKARLDGITCAKPENHHDMVRLKQAILKAEALHVPDELIMEARALFDRLDAEEKMSIALASVPEVRLPKEEPPEGYWRESDTGHIEHTEEYPLPPEGGEYVWIPSETYSALLNCIEGLRGCTDGAEELGANEEVRLEAIATLKKAEKDIKLLEVKNEEDKQAATEQAQKEAKKLKKKKKK